MEFVKNKWRFIVEFVMMSVAVGLSCYYVSEFGWPSNGIIAVYVAWLIYFFVQLKVKLGLTLPFAFIVVWMILAIQDWNDNQAVKSFDVEDYYLAIAYVMHALNGAIIYFENKMRW